MIKRYIDEDDLHRFMIKEEVDLVFPLIEGSETGRIDRKALTNWVVMAFIYMYKTMSCLSRIQVHCIHILHSLIFESFR